jgi:hypothetical protein
MTATYLKKMVEDNLSVDQGETIMTLADKIKQEGTLELNRAGLRKLEGS